MSGKTFWRVIIFTGIYMIFPIALAMLASILAPFLGCAELSEGSIPKCPAGETLTGMFFMVWLAGFTIPSGSMIIVIALLLRADS